MNNFFVYFAEQFQLNILDANRWKLLLNGLGMTVTVSIFAIMVGIVLGLLAVSLKLMNTRFHWVNKICRGAAYVYVDIIRSTPFVIQLFIMYYVIFVSGVSRPVVAIIAFGINSGAYVSEVFRAGILSIDKGQTEAGLSLGFSKISTMVLIVLPQAVKNSIPALVNEFVSLIKETAIMGYIGMTDLTRAGSIIISRTYTAAFPYLTVAVIYYVIIKCLTLVMQRLERRLRRSDLR